jgi:hypothetical protein
LVTHFGTFELRDSPVLPAPGPTPQTVAIARPRLNNREECLVAMPVVRPKTAQPQSREIEL